jgi:hypothetical protein
LGRPSVFKFFFTARFGLRSASYAPTGRSSHRVRREFLFYFFSLILQKTQADREDKKNKPKPFPPSIKLPSSLWQASVFALPSYAETRRRDKMARQAGQVLRIEGQSLNSELYLPFYAINCDLEESCSIYFILKPVAILDQLKLII